MTAPLEGKCPNCSNGLPLSYAHYPAQGFEPQNVHHFIEVGDDLECGRCEATFSVISLTPLKLSLQGRPPAHKRYPKLDEIGAVEAGTKVFLRDPARVFEVVDRALQVHRKVTVSVTTVWPSWSGYVVEVMDARC